MAVVIGAVALVQNNISDKFGINIIKYLGLFPVIEIIVPINYFIIMVGVLFFWSFIWRWMEKRMVSLWRVPFFLLLDFHIEIRVVYGYNSSGKALLRAHFEKNHEKFKASKIKYKFTKMCFHNKLLYYIMVFKKKCVFIWGVIFKMGTKITKIISYLLIISMIMTGLAYAAEGLNSSNEISTYGQNFYSRDVQKLSNVEY